jgi:peptide/nickel transport system permease protein
VLRFLIKRTLSGILVLGIFLFVMFLLIEWLIPGDIATPFRLSMTADELEEFRRAFGLDRALPIRFWFWLKLFVQHGWGQTTFGGASSLGDAIAPTLVVFVLGIGIAYLFGGWLGRWTGWRRDLAADGVTFLGIATYTLFPPFLGFLLIYHLGDNVFTVRSWFLDETRNQLWMRAGEMGIDRQSTMWNIVITVLVAALVIGAIASFASRHRNWRILGMPLFLGTALLSYGYWLVRGTTDFAVDILFAASLPLIGFILLSYGEFLLVMQTSMIGVVHEDYVLVARAKGLAPRLVRDRHAGRTALLPLLSRFAVSLPYLVTGLVIIERAVGWPGLGSLLFRAVEAQDMPLVMDALALLGLLTLVVRLILEVSTAALDPRLRRPVGAKGTARS